MNTGTYGAYPDNSTSTELTLALDKTFTYVDRFESTTTNSSGKWKVAGKKLVLYGFESVNTPVKWKIREYDICSATPTTHWEERCLELQMTK